MTHRIPKCHPDRKFYAKDRCKSCYAKWRYHEDPTPHIIKAKRYRAENPDKVKALDFAQNLHTKYGLTVEAYTTLLQSQGGKCKICETPLAVPLVDHCHKTGKVRALLCRKCNSGLGMFRDDTIIMQRAINYVVAHG